MKFLKPEACFSGRNFTVYFIFNKKIRKTRQNFSKPAEIEKC